jgi:circadian clock protein KaiC
MLIQTAGVGMQLKPLLECGDLEVSFRAPMENILDKLGAQLLAVIRERGARRLFLDGYDALQKAAVRHTRSARFLTALVNECRIRGVTLLYSVETTTAFGPQVEFPMRGISMVGENILFLRSAEVRSELRRFICVLKMRTSGYDHALRELHISDKGLSVRETFDDAQQLMTGLPRSTLPSPRVPEHRGK